MDSFTDLLRLLDELNENETLEENRELFIQLLGTVMGRKVTPTYAILFMNKLERIIIPNCPTDHPYQARGIWSTLPRGGGLIQPGSWKTPPAVDMNFFLHTLLEIHIFKATMQSFSSLA